MDTFSTSRFSPALTRVLRVALALLVLGAYATSAHAVSSWKPTLLVNTESFQEIDSGDGTTDIELRFGASTQTIKFLTTGKFRFSHGVSVLGNLSGSSLRVDGLAEVHGALSASGAVRTDGALTINDDADTNDATLTFGNASGNQTFKFLNTGQKFQISKTLSVVGGLSGSWLNVDGPGTVSGALTVKGNIRGKGSISGSTLTVDGNVTLRGVTYSAPTSQGASNTFLKNDGAGNLTWTATSVGNASGGILSLHPVYPNAVYFSSGSVYIGQLTMSGGTSALDNSYVWTSSRSGIQDYWISVRARLPDNFSSWDPVKPIELRYKTGVGGGEATTTNHITPRMRDTAGALVSLSTGALINTSFTTARVTGPESAGTWTPKGYFTFYIKLAANSTASAYAALSFINFNFETTTP